MSNLLLSIVWIYQIINNTCNDLGIIRYILSSYFYPRLFYWDMSEDPLIMDYFDNLDNESLNKYKNNLKIKNIYRFVLLPLYWWSFKFHVILLLFDSPSKTVKLESLQIT
jgi:hypothetical protein